MQNALEVFTVPLEGYTLSCAKCKVKCTNALMLIGPKNLYFCLPTYIASHLAAKNVTMWERKMREKKKKEKNKIEKRREKKRNQLDM